MPTYTFILTAYKGKYLSQAIESILGQTYRDFSLIIVDDASPDDLKSIVAQYHDSRISFYRCEQNTGRIDLVRHWNNCLMHAHSDYVILASDDDVYHPDFLAEIHQLACSYPQIDVIHGRIRIVDDNGTTLVASQPLDRIMSAAEFLNAFANERILSSLQNYVFKRQALIDMGGIVNFPLAWHADDATVLSLSTRGVACTEDIVFDFRSSGQNISSAHDTDAQKLSRKLKARNLFYRWLNDFYLPKLASCQIDIDDRTRDQLRQKLRHLTFTMLHNSDPHAAWRARRAFIESDYITAAEFYRAYARKLWLDYKYIFEYKRWIKRLSHSISR